jgi:periplasmic copper chaperone A
MNSSKRNTFLAGAMLVSASLVGALGWLNSASANSFKAGELSIEQPYANASTAGTKTGAAYFSKIKNTGTRPDKLISAKTTVAQSVEIHTMKMDGNIMRMREISGIDLPAGQEVLFGQGTDNGYHLMLMGLKEPLKDGEPFKLILKFERAGEVEVLVQVQKAKSGTDIHKHH